MVECNYCNKKFGNAVQRDAHILREHLHSNKTDKEFAEWFEKQPILWRKRFSLKGRCVEYIPTIENCFTDYKKCPLCKGRMKKVMVSVEQHRRDKDQEAFPVWQCQYCDYVEEVK